MGKGHSKSSRRNGSIKLVVYSVCGHSEERRYGEVAAVADDTRHCLLGVGESWLPKNTECRAGWCPACFVYYRRHQLAIVDETVIENYWDYLTRHQWTRPVEPGQVRIDALRCTNNNNSSRQRPAHEVVAACLYSLRLDASSSTWSCRPSGRTRTLAAATSIREGTLAWTARVRAEAQSWARQAYRDYVSSKPLPRIPKSDEREYHLSWTPSPFAASQQHNRGGEDTRVSVLQALNTAIDETLQTLQSASERLALMAAERDHHSSKITTPAARHGRYVRAQDNDLMMSSSPLPTSTAGSSGFRTPSHRTPSPPPRPSRTMARCQRHGHVDPARVVDMSCDLCARLGLVESTVPVGSPLGLRPCDVQFLDVGAQPGVLAAMHGTCCCGDEGPCVSCLARRDFAVRTGVAWI